MGFMADLIIAILVISGISVGLLSFLDALGTKYSSTVTEPFSEADKEVIRKINYTSRITSDVTDPLKEKLKTAAEKNVLENIAGFFVGSVVSAGLLIINIPTIILSFVAAMTAPFTAPYLNILPYWVISMINAIILFMFVIVIIRLIMKWKL